MSSSAFCVVLMSSIRLAYIWLNDSRTGVQALTERQVVEDGKRRVRGRVSSVS